MARYRSDPPTMADSMPGPRPVNPSVHSAPPTRPETSRSVSPTLVGADGAWSSARPTVESDPAADLAATLRTVVGIGNPPAPRGSENGFHWQQRTCRVVTRAGTPGVAAAPAGPRAVARGQGPSGTWAPRRPEKCNEPGHSRARDSGPSAFTARRRGGRGPRTAA